MKCNKILSCFAVLSFVFVSLPARTQVSDYKTLVEEWNKPVKAFRMIGNIHYVGTNFLACYLITTPAGHILIDTGMQESGPLVRANIEALGFKLSEIRIILSSHSHFDHVAGHADMKAATGAQVYALEADAVILESGGTRSFNPMRPYKPVKVDKMLKDGEVVRLGNAALTAHLTPGHTEGNTTWTTTVEEGGKKYNVVFVGSMSINPGVRMVNNAKWPKIDEAYGRSFQILKSLPCDVFLGPHGIFFDLEKKIRLMTNGARSNPFIDPESYRNYIADYEKGYRDQILQEESGKGK
jgi:metallo-beta-lactamase class B